MRKAWRQLAFMKAVLLQHKRWLVPLHSGGRRGTWWPCGHECSAAEVALDDIFPKKKTEVFQVILQNWWAKMSKTMFYIFFFLMLWRNKKPRKNITLSIPIEVIIPLTIMDLSIWLNSFARRKKKAEYKDAPL